MKKKGKKKKWKIAVAIAALLIIARAAAGIFLGGGEEAVPMVDTAEAVRGDITSTLDTSGTITSELTRVYASPVNAQVGEVPAVLGESVKKGEYLLTYDTESLQKSYNIAELQAKAEEAVTNDSLTKSSESARDLASSEGDIQSLKNQIDAVNAEISALQAQASNNEIKTNNNTAAHEEINALSAELEAMKARIAELEADEALGTLSSREKEELKSLKKEIKTKEQKIDKKKKSLKGSAELANNMTNIQAQLTQKNNQLADLQSRLGEAQSKNAAAEAGVLSDAAKANINYTKQAGRLTLEQSADDLSRAKAGITADFDGIVTEVAASAGTIASEGTPLITLASASDMCVELLVSKYNLENLKTGQSAVITFQDKEYNGTVSYISKIAQKGESGAAMVTVKVHIDKPDDALVLGLDAKVAVHLGTAENVVTAPVSAVNSDTQGDFVYVAENGVVVKKYVTSGIASAEEIEIKSGLEAGEKVIVTVDSSIMEGMAVAENEWQGAGEMTTGEEAGLETEAAE